MKKLVILGTALLALNAVASEFQLKGGYDFSRKYKNGASAVGEDFRLKGGPTLGLEYILDNQGEFETYTSILIDNEEVINDFFDKVIINDENTEIKNNRISLLKKLEKNTDKILNL